MSTIHITTLTPVHIGSGNLLQFNTDFVSFCFQEIPMIGIVDDRKILELIGVEHLNDWVRSIERQESTIDLVNRYAPKSTIGQYLKRYGQRYGNTVKPTDTLKECIHTGMGRPYIPGSSLKGAIRTAVTATLAKRDLPPLTQRQEAKSLASRTEKYLFGASPQEDVFRFIQVGDAHFAEQSEVYLKLITSLNITHQDSLRPAREEKPQWVEAIAYDEEATCSIKIDLPTYQRAQPEMARMGTLPAEMQTVEALFRLINQHTRQLIEEEIDFWKKMGQEHTGAEPYIEKMGEILSQVEECEAGSCVLRLGHASGWRFITGAWGEHLRYFHPYIVDMARPRNSECYREYAFPKSRRTDVDGDLLGFIKLTLS